MEWDIWYVCIASINLQLERQENCSINIFVWCTSNSALHVIHLYLGKLSAMHVLQPLPKDLKIVQLGTLESYVTVNNIESAL